LVRLVHVVETVPVLISHPTKSPNGGIFTDIDDDGSGDDTPAELNAEVRSYPITRRTTITVLRDAHVTATVPDVPVGLATNITDPQAVVPFPVLAAVILVADTPPMVAVGVFPGLLPTLPWKAKTIIHLLASSGPKLTDVCDVAAVVLLSVSWTDASLNPANGPTIPGNIRRSP
jgi:hypothetical protein